MKANINAEPAKVKATGKPKSKKIQTKAKRINGRKSIMFENQLNQLRKALKDQKNRKNN